MDRRIGRKVKPEPDVRGGVHPLRIATFSYVRSAGVEPSHKRCQNCSAEILLAAAAACAACREAAKHGALQGMAQTVLLRIATFSYVRSAGVEPSHKRCQNCSAEILLAAAGMCSMQGSSKAWCTAR